MNNTKTEDELLLLAIAGCSTANDAAFIIGITKMFAQRDQLAVIKKEIDDMIKERGCNALVRWGLILAESKIDEMKKAIEETI